MAMSTSAMVTLKSRRENNKNIATVVIPRRIFTLLRTMRPDSVELKFGVNESFHVTAEAFAKLLEDTYGKR